MESCLASTTATILKNQQGEKFLEKIITTDETLICCLLSTSKQGFPASSTQNIKNQPFYQKIYGHFISQNFPEWCISTQFQKTVVTVVFHRNTLKIIQCHISCRKKHFNKRNWNLHYYNSKAHIVKFIAKSCQNHCEVYSSFSPTPLLKVFLII